MITVFGVDFYCRILAVAGYLFCVFFHPEWIPAVLGNNHPLLIIAICHVLSFSGARK